MAKYKTKKEKHPLYHTWAWIRRMSVKHSMSKEWKEDFYRFVGDVGERPTPRHRLCRTDESKGYGQDNFYWKESIPYKEGAAYQREWRKQNPLKTKGYDLKRVFGITLDDFNSLLDKQNNLCAICGEPERMNGSLAVDHDHETGKIRGLLCTNCNRGLGHMKDSIVNLTKAIEYLRLHDVSKNLL